MAVDRLRRFVAPLALLAALAAPALAQEHPEHPEHPKDEAAAGPALSTDQLADAITHYVHAQSKDGWWTVQDAVQGKALKLELDKVHRERLARVGPDTYFACADFVADDGVKYDLDVFMKGTEADHLQFAEVSVHKQNGVARYNWKEADGVWTKEPVAP